MSQETTQAASSPKPRVALFGGTFNPVHLGHRKAIDLLFATGAFERVHWVLSARPPHKDSVQTSVQQRFEMLQAGISDNPHYIADDTEIRRASKSYTIDTVTTFQRANPDTDFVMVIGGDSLMKLHTWHRIDELIDQVNWVVLHRPGYQLELPDWLSGRQVASLEALSEQTGRIVLFELSDIDVSSTELRAVLAEPDGDQQPIVEKFLSPAVINYIRAHQLYTIKAHQAESKNMNSEQIKDQVVDAIENVKGQDIRVIDIARISDFADYMVVVSGTSDTHVKALAREASDTLRKLDVKPLNEDGADVGEWVLVDFGDVVLHVMRPEVREYYDLEKLWDEDVRKLMQQHREQQADQELNDG